MFVAVKVSIEACVCCFNVEFQSVFLWKCDLTIRDCVLCARILNQWIDKGSKLLQLEGGHNNVIPNWLITYQMNFTFITNDAICSSFGSERQMATKMLDKRIQDDWYTIDIGCWAFKN